jgi:hypothetical protein
MTYWQSILVGLDALVFGLLAMALADRLLPQPRK